MWSKPVSYFNFDTEFINYLTSFFKYLGFDDSFRAVDRLSSYAFDLQVNVSVKHLQELNEAF